MGDSSGCSTQVLGASHEVLRAVTTAGTVVCLLAAYAVAKPNSFGMNVCPASDYDGMRIFADAMKLTREWQEEPATPIAVDENGWPLSDGGTCVYHNAKANGGTYGLYFTTQNPSVDARTVQVRDIWGTAQISNMRYDAATNTVAYDFVAGSPTQLKLGFSNTNGGVKDVKLMRPTTEGGNTPFDTSVTFTDFGKDLLRTFQVVRFQAWNACLNTNMIANWEDRTTPDYSTTNRMFQGGPTGVAWEYIIQLCNEAQIDLYGNIPCLATDDYIRQLATLMKNTLDPERKIYIEYANELWNFPGPWDAHRNRLLALDEMAGSGDYPYDYDGATGEYVWAARRTVCMGVKISTIFREVFGDDQMMTRVRPLLCEQVGNGQGTVSGALWFLFDYFGNPDNVAIPHPPKYFFYGVACAPYYNPDPTASINDIWTSGNFNGNNFATNLIETDAQLTATFGLPLCAYEGGPEMSLGTTGPAAWSDPRMTDLIVQNHHIFSQYGGELFTYTEAIHWGDTSDVAYSFVHNAEDTDTPKMDALAILASSDREAITYGRLAPVTIAGRAFDFARMWGDSGQGSVDLITDDPSFGDRAFGYVIRVETPGVYGITANFTSGNGTVDIYADANLAGTVSASAAGASQKTDVDLQEGLHGILVRANTGSVALNSIAITFEGPSAALVARSAQSGPQLHIVQQNGGMLVISAGAQTRGVTIATLGGRLVAALDKGRDGTFEIPARALGSGVFVVTTKGTVQQTRSFAIR